MVSGLSCLEQDSGSSIYILHVSMYDVFIIYGWHIDTGHSFAYI